jgi:hypothetical protein
MGGIKTNAASMVAVVAVAMTQGRGKTNVEDIREVGEGATASKVAAGMVAGMAQAMVGTSKGTEEAVEDKVEEGIEKLPESNGAMALNRNLATLKR